MSLASGEAVPRPPLLPRRFLLVAFTFSLAVLLYVDRACIAAAKGPMTRELGLTDREFGWVFSSFALGYALFQTPSGVLADRLGPRRMLAAVVALWSLLTGLTAAAAGLLSLLGLRFLFGAGEAGGFPGVARAAYSWIPLRERGAVTGINFAGGRLGAALSLPLFAWMVDALGWRPSFLVLMVAGLLWAILWFWWFRDDPARHRGLGAAERDLILEQRQKPEPGGERPLPVHVLLRSRNLALAMAQYFASNFTFFFCLTWLPPHLAARFELDSIRAGWYAALPLLAGAVGNVTAGFLTDRLWRSGRPRLSRQLPAMAGFVLAAAGLAASVLAEGPGAAVAWLSLAIFGADMTLAPSWAFCIDIGRANAGAVAGTMNMAGNLGSFVTSLAFPYLLSWTGRTEPFFLAGAALNVAAAFIWTAMRPERTIEEY